MEIGDVMLVPALSIGMIYSLVQNGSRSVVFVCAFGILLINLLIFYLYQSLVEYYSAYMETSMLEQLVEVYTHQLEIVQESQKNMKALRHDLKHHLIELSAMAKEDGNAAMLDYLEEMKQFMLNPKEYVSTGNQDIDGVLNYLLQSADKILHQVDIRINLPEKLFQKNFKICVILGNLVDNALREAAKSEEKRLGIHIYTKKGILFIFIRNSYNGECGYDQKKDSAAQNDLAIHGIGLENVKKIVEMSDGEMSVHYTEHEFEVRVLLYLSEVKDAEGNLRLVCVSHISENENTAFSTQACTVCLFIF